MSATHAEQSPPKTPYRMPPEERRCTATSSRTGERCTAWKARGKEMCAGHAGLGVAAGGSVARAAQQRGAEARSALRREARVLTVMTPRERMNADLVQRVEDGRVVAALDRGLADPDAKTALTAAGMVLDRLLGRPVAVTEVQLPGTQAYAELRATLGTLPPEDRLAYLREARMAADVATTTPHGHELVSGEEGGA